VTRLATLIIEKKRFFFPMPEEIMTAPNDGEKPGKFVELFPHPLSRLYLALQWKINSEQEGDAVVLSNVWLRSFAKLENRSLLRYRKFLNNECIIYAKPLRNGREWLYRICDSSTGLPLTNEADTEAVKRMKDPGRIREVIRTRVMRRYKKQVTDAAPIPIQEKEMTPSSWSE
jgi:hypothetical protein